MDSLVNSLIQAIHELNVEEAIYWSHLLLRESKQRKIVQLPIDQFFIGLSLGNEELSSVLCQLIWESVKNEDYPVIIEKYRAEIIKGLSMEIEDVQKLCLRIIYELSQGTTNKIDPELLNHSLNLIVKSNYSVSSFLVQIIIKTFPNNPQISNILLQLYSSSRNDSVVQFRFLELFLKMNLNDQSDPLYKTFFNELRSILSEDPSDKLMIANGLQIIQDCIHERDQFLLFKAEGIIDIIIKYIQSNNVNNGDILKSKSFDILAHCSLLNCFDYDFIEENGLDRAVLEGDKTESSVFCCAAFATLSPNPKRLLSSFPEHLVHGTSSIQMAALHGIGIFFKSSNRPDVKLEFLLNLIENVNNFFKWLSERINSTFDEQKSAGYFALKSILSSETCFKHVLDTTTIISDLLDRTKDDSQVGLKWKYGIFEQIHSDPSLFACLNGPLKDQVSKYLGQGVTFVPKSSRIAFESQ